jgi:hypothetical protein
MAMASEQEISIVSATPSKQTTNPNKDIYQIIAHGDIYGKYSKKYEGYYTLTDIAVETYIRIYESVHNKKPEYVNKWLSDYNLNELEENTNIIDDPILIEVVKELGSLKAFKYSGRHQQNHFNIWTIDIKYKPYCRVKTWSDGSLELEVDYNRYKMDIIRQIAACEKEVSDVYIRITDLLSQKDEIPTHEWI